MSTPPGTIVVGVDGSQPAADALLWAVDQAAAERVPLTLVHAAHEVHADFTDETAVHAQHLAATLHEEGYRIVERARVEALHRSPGLEVHCLVEVRDPRELLLHLSQEARMVVVGSRGRGPVRSLLLGSVGVALARHAACPVVVHRTPDAATRGTGILAAVDAPDDSRPVLELAYRLADLRHAPLTLVHCYGDLRSVLDAGYVDPDPAASLQEATRALALAQDGLGARYPDVHVTTTLVEGSSTAHLVRAAASTELLVVGSHHASRLSALVVGSVSLALVEHAPCPVVVVPLHAG